MDGVDVKTVRHIEFQLPEGVSYRAGDHIGVLPHNSPAAVRRGAERFRLELDDMLIVEANSAESTHLPVGEWIDVRTLLTDYVELQATANRRNVQSMLASTTYPWSRDVLAGLVDDSDNFRRIVVEPHMSVLDLLGGAPGLRTQLR